MHDIPDDIMLHLLRSGCTQLAATCSRFRRLFDGMLDPEKAAAVAEHLTDAYGPCWAMTIALHIGCDSLLAAVAPKSPYDDAPVWPDPTYYLFRHRTDVSVSTFWKSHCSWVFRYATNTYLLSMKTNFHDRPEMIMAAAHAWTSVHGCPDTGIRLVMLAIVCTIRRPFATKLLRVIQRLYPHLGHTHAPLDLRQDIWTTVGRYGSVSCAEYLHRYLGPSIADMCTLATTAHAYARITVWQWALSKGGVVLNWRQRAGVDE